MRRDYLLFDLDGTLTDSGEGIINSVIYALEAYGIHEEDRDALRSFVGPPLVESLTTRYGFTPEKADEAVEKYREYFTDKGMFENRVYEGIPQMLERLQAAGKTLLVATSKPTVYSVEILEHFGLAKYFTDIQGSCLDGTRMSKAEVVRFCLEVNGITDTSRAVMVGDRKYDVCGARQNGLDTVGVLYGYGKRQELLDAGAWKIAETVADLEELLLAL